jgi:hypothetical protein
MITHRSILALLTLTAVTSLPASAVTESTKRAVKVDIKQNQASEFVISVQHAKDGFRMLTVLPDFDAPSQGGVSPRDRDLAQFVGWRDDYLFVRQRGALSTPWRSVVDHVFTVQGERLVHLGSIDARECAALACGYANGEFRDIFDGLEVNPATGNVDTPPVPIVRVVREGRLVTHIERTWEINQQNYRASTACVSVAAQEGLSGRCPEERTPWASLVFVAKLTQYTGRAQERAQLFSQLAPAYCAKTPDKRCTFRVAGIDEHTARIARGAPPLNTPYAVTALLDQSSQDSTRTTAWAPGKTIKLP